MSFSPTTSSSAHYTFVRGTIHPHQNVVATVPTVSATSSTSSRSVNVVTTVVTLYRNVAANVSTPRLVGTVDKKLSYNPYLLSSTVRFRHLLMEIALWMKKDKVPLAVEYFDAINYKLLRIDVNNIDKLMKAIRNGCLNIFLRNVYELGFNQQSLLKMATLAKKATSLLTISYTTALQEVYHMNPTDDAQDLTYSNVTTYPLQEVPYDGFPCHTKTLPY